MRWTQWFESSKLKTKKKRRASENIWLLLRVKQGRSAFSSLVYNKHPNMQTYFFGIHIWLTVGLFWIFFQWKDVPVVMSYVEASWAVKVSHNCELSVATMWQSQNNFGFLPWRMHHAPASSLFLFHRNPQENKRCVRRPKISGVRKGRQTLRFSL